MAPLALQGCTRKSDTEDKYATYLFEGSNFVSDVFKQNREAQPHTWVQSRQIQWIETQGALTATQVLTCG